MARRKMQWREWWKAGLVDALRIGQPSEIVGPSVRGAAKDLGISQQAVSNAIARGSLDEIRVFDRGVVRLVIITEASIARYKVSGRRRVPDQAQLTL